MYSFLSGNRQHLHYKMNMETFHFHFPFTSDDKRELVEIIKKFARQGFPFTKTKVMNLAYEYALINGQKGFRKLTKWTLCLVTKFSQKIPRGAHQERPQLVCQQGNVC